MGLAGDVARQPEPERRLGVDLGGVGEERFEADVGVAVDVDRRGDPVVLPRTVEPLLAVGRLEAQLEVIKPRLIVPLGRWVLFEACHQVAESLNTTGLYSVVRHPLYLGNFLMWLGVALFPRSLSFVAAVVFAFWLYYERIMIAEEAFLRERFGERFDAWADRTPAFIPSLRRWTRPRLAFSLRKVLRKEYNGLLAVVAVAVVTLCFVLPFLGLLTRPPKKVPAVLAFFAGLILVGHWLERFLITVPSISLPGSGHGNIFFLF